MTRRAEGAALAVILAVYLALAGLYAARTPDWQAPDEPAHYNYVRQIADEGRLPVIAPGDWQQEYQEQLKDSGFAPALLDRLDTIQYEDHQPPLYYLLQTPVYALSGGDLLALRLMSALLGAGAVIGAWAVIRAALPGRTSLALAGAGFVAFLPQRLSIAASVNNDALADLVVALTLWAAVVYLRGAPRARPLALGVLVGIALITKTTVYFLAGIVALAVLLRWRRERWPPRTAAAHLAAAILPALLIGGVWWARNLDTYGGTDFTGLARHDEVTVGQVRTGEYIEGVLGGDERQYLENMLRTTFHSFWGQFGWMAVPLPGTAYRALWLITLGLLAGAAIYAWRERFPCALDGPARDALIVFAAVIVLVIAAFLLYNREFVQFQGRYLYPALIPLALGVAAGLRGWAGLVFGRRAPADWLPLAAIAALALFALYALEMYLVPNL
ncbi:MAG: glycosyltransferase family 39 protein [Anaerolineae bacterium]|nr:glycosyltransferase family 39 protein [Anaerolineae bacterium]